MCSITYKNQPPNNLAKYQYFYTGDLTKTVVANGYFQKKKQMSLKLIQTSKMEQSKMETFLKTVNGF